MSGDHAAAERDRRGARHGLTSRVDSQPCSSPKGANVRRASAIVVAPFCLNSVGPASAICASVAPCGAAIDVDCLPGDPFAAIAYEKKNHLGAFGAVARVA